MPGPAPRDEFEAALLRCVLDLGQCHPEHLGRSDVDQLVEFIEHNEWEICVEDMCALHVELDITPSPEFARLVHDLVDQSGYGYGTGCICIADFIDRFPRSGA
jgi:hypothetical protein